MTPESSCHAMDADGLRRSGSRLYALRDADGIVRAVGALKPLDADGVELKSMHVARNARGCGLGRTLLAHLLNAARAEGARQAFLETGSEPGFAAARALYESAGFTYCAPFADYTPDPLSVFMTRPL
jgi:putative acetyltransferase